jgi:ribosomal protein S18 acetylase RimI-like enzyme
MLGSDEWDTLRIVRLAALRDSPDNFLSTYDREKYYGEDKWKAEFKRGNWAVGTLDNKDVSLIGITREIHMPSHECNLEYIWVARAFRQQGVGADMMNAVLGDLRESGVRTAFLAVLDGNTVAMRLYERIGFARTGPPVPLPSRPGRSEELLRLDLA